MKKIRLDAARTGAAAVERCVCAVDRQSLQALAGKGPAGIGPALLAQARREGFRGREGETFFHRPAANGGPAVLLVGLGSRDKVDAERARRAGANACRALPRRGAKRTGLSLVASLRSGREKLAAALAEGFLLAAYRFDRYLKRPAAGDLERLTLLAETAAGQRALERELRIVEAKVEAAHLARDLVNEPAGEKLPARFASRVKELIRGSGLRLKALGPAEVRKGAFAGLSAVARGSESGPHFLHLEYRPPRPRAGAVCLIGKGVTFDAGGLHLKNPRQMQGMKGDMSGAAAVLAATLAAARLQIPLRIHTLIPLAENMPGPTALRPGDILRFANGKSVEIVDTDAEGRLLLADALCYAQSLGVRQIVELSTLTGGCLYALGRECAALLCDQPQLREGLLRASRESGEMIWPLPLIEEYRRELRGKISDLRNVGKGLAGTITAALFLREFSGDIPFAHLDIAGTAFHDERPFLPYHDVGGSGFGARLLIDFLR